MKSESTANCVEEQGRNCNLVVNVDPFQMSSLSIRSQPPVLLKLEECCKM